MVIHYERVLKGPIQMGGDLTFDEVNAPWLIDKIELAAEDNLHDTTGDFHPDHFRVYVRGGERGEPHNVNLLNAREGTGPLSHVCGFCIVTPELAKQAAADLRHLIQADSSV